MLAQWILLLAMLPGWLLPSGAHLPLCGCLFREPAESGCCSESSEPERSCCPTEEEEQDPRAPDCPCSVSTPEADKGVLPGAPLTTTLGLERRLPMAAWAPGQSLPWTVAVELRTRGPCPGAYCLPLRL